ncbi:MAG: DUF177 domain-containing protein [Acidobacteria bacterium]|nr:DUF177 domain-containing protein [Acidobacteriota bacterium]
MFIDIRELERDKLDFAQEFPPGRIDLGKDASQSDRLEVEGLAELIASEIRLQGHLRTTVEVSCARCLEPVQLPVEKDFDLYYRPVQTIAREEEVEIDDAELEVGFYQGNGLLLEDALKEQILLDLPMKSLCRPDCRGICPQCGQNRNVVQCDCRQRAVADRWAPLAQFKK